MASIEYSLFRAKFIKSSQKDLHQFVHNEMDLTPKELFLNALNEKPSLEIRKGSYWHIGNNKLFSEYAGYFAVGRTANTNIEKFDEQSHDFVEEQGEESSYTHCLFNADIGFIGIAKKASLAPTAESIARYIEKLLSITKIVLENQITVEIRPIPDPEDFLKKIASAYSVTQFTATFRGPNPFDADAYFQKPLSVYLSAANGETGKAEINGVDLNRDVIQSVTRSTAATGNEATARIKKTSKQKKPNKISLKGDPIKFRFEEEEHSQEALACLTNLYHQVRDDRRD